MYTDRLRFCKEKIVCCRAMLERAVKCLGFVEDKEGDLACYNRYTAHVSGMPELLIPEKEAEKTRKDVERAMGILEGMEKLKDVSLKELSFVHDMYNRIEDGSHGDDDIHWDVCKYV